MKPGRVTDDARTLKGRGILGEIQFGGAGSILHHQQPAAEPLFNVVTVVANRGRKSVPTDNRSTSSGIVKFSILLKFAAERLDLRDECITGNLDHAAEWLRLS